MGYWVSFVSNDEHEREFWSASHTRNTGPMWSDALGDTLRNTIDNTPDLSELEVKLAEGIRKMEANPEKYRAMNPSNGFGTYESALAFLREIHQMCCLFIGAAGVKIHVSS